MWEHIEEFGDLHTVLYAEDCIVLHLETPWPTDSPVPNGCVLIPDSGLLTTNTKSLVAAKSALTEVKIRGALFAGCVEFKSSESLQDAVGQLLRATQKICIFHNRNAIYNLIRLFPNAKILALLHDLARHVIEEDEPYVNPLEPLVESSLLTDVIGSVGWINSGVLRISWVTLLAIFRTCPLIRRIDSFLVPAAFCTLREEYRCAEGNRFHYLSLYALHPASATPVAATASLISVSRLTFPFLEHLEVSG
ncbi:uncharacterized protein LOC144180530 isoform X3 [Haemaphysalis longicornis]